MLTNPVPVTVKVCEGAPAVTEVGDIEVTVGGVGDVGDVGVVPVPPPLAGELPHPETKMHTPRLKERARKMEDFIRESVLACNPRGDQ